MATPHRATASAILIAVGLMASGCGTAAVAPSPQSPQPAVPEAPSPFLAILSPAQGALVANPVTVRLDIRHFRLVNPKSTPGDVPGEGHIRAYIDGRTMQETEAAFRLPDLGKGPHQLRVVLVQNGGRSLAPAVDAAASFSVRAAPPKKTSPPSGVAVGGSDTRTKTGVPATIQIGEARVNDVVQKVLVDGQGMTLYYFQQDTPEGTACSGGCAEVWPPFTLPSGAPTTASALLGEASVLLDANGRQILYNGHPLYTYSGDSAPGQAHGQGVGGNWYAATPGIKAPPAGGFKG